MLRKINELRTQKGSMMIEALAMLGLISMVTPVIYKKAAERTTEMRDINAASQVRTVVKAIDDYLRDNYGTITGGGEVTSSTSTVDYSDFAGSGADTKSKIVNIDHFKDYLPLGFQAEGKLFKGFDVAIKQVSDDGGRKALTTVLIAKTSTDGKVDPTFTKIRSSRIASMIGTNGGYIDGDKATGVQGVWEIPKSELPSSADTGTIVATSIEAVADGTAGGSDVLHRVHVDGHPEYNVMETTLSMNNNTIDGLHELISHGNTIKMRQQTESNALTLDVSGSGLFEDTLEIGDALSKGNRFYADRDVLAHSNALYIGAAVDGHQKANAAFYVDGSDGSFHAAKSQDETDPKFEVSSAGNTRADGTLKAAKYKETVNSYGSSTHVLYAASNLAKINPTSILHLATGKKSNEDLMNSIYGRKTDGAGIQLINSTMYNYGSTIYNTTKSFNIRYKNESNEEQGGTVNFYNGLAKFQGKGGYAADEIPASNKVTFNANAFIDGGFGAYKLGTDKYNLTVDSEATVESAFRAGATASTDTNTKKAYNLNIESSDATLESGMSFDRFSTGAGTAYGTTVGDLGSIDGTEFGHGLKTGYNTSKKQYQAIFGQKYSRIGDPDNTYIQIRHEQAAATDSVKIHSQFLNSPLGNFESAFNINYIQPSLETKYSNSSVSHNYKFAINPFVGPLFSYNNDTILSIGTQQTSTAPVYIRKGAIEIARQKGSLSIGDEYSGATESTSHIKVDRLVSNAAKLASTVDGTGSGDYDIFQINPAYTSMMNDIKLASRGGARLSDILPDFINKGIYVMDNTYTGGTDWTTATVKNDYSITGITECGENQTKCDTTAWMGFIPTPNCPPGYMKVATITPIRFNMAQAGTTNRLTDTTSIKGLPNNIDPDHYRALYVHRDPRGDDNLILVDSGEVRSSNTFVALPADNLTGGPTLADQQTKIRTQGDPTVLTVKQATIINQPYNYQINTWLNTTLKGHYQRGNTNMNHLDDENPNKPTYFKGWHGIMGFIYPADDYRDYYNAAFNQTTTGNSSEIFWNLFPVYKQELSAIATVYCYFDRTNTTKFSSDYVDSYLPHDVGLNEIRNESKGTTSPDYNDPALTYTTVW